MNTDHRKRSVATTARNCAARCSRAGRAGAVSAFTQPGHPEQNAYIERFNGTYRSEVLDAYQFETIAEARRVSEANRTLYNEQRAHSPIGHLPPRVFKRRWQ